MAFDVNTPEEIGKLLDAYGAAADKNAFISDLEKEVGSMTEKADISTPNPNPNPASVPNPTEQVKHQEGEKEKKKPKDECPEGKLWDVEKKECVDKPEEKKEEKKEEQSKDAEIEKLRSVAASIKAELVDEISKLTGLCPTKLGLWDVDALILLRKVIKSSQVEKKENADKVSIPGARRSPKVGLDAKRPVEFTPSYPALEVIIE